ncbi:MAG: PaaI family thioesterase [Anaerolineae bacterium]|nr:PaaI family thioesterase [Anaerolineae bacterium]MDW8067911.1 PaaI family thioesterase [Anaerolineae bacterium]
MRPQPTSRMCFVCGRENPCGLKLKFYEDPESRVVRAELTLPEYYQGYPGIAHGGVIAAILDEISGRAVMLQTSTETFMVTLRLIVRYRRPTPVGVPLVAVGWVEQLGQAGARVAGQIRLPDGTITAEGEALLAVAPEEFRARWEAERSYWRIE